MAAGRRPRLAGISSFGFTGINAHLVLEEPPLRADDPSQPKPACHLLPLSAKDPHALRQLADHYAARLTGPSPGRLEDVCFSALVGRSHFDHRLAVVADDAAAVGQCLNSFLRGRESAGLFVADNGGDRGKVAFIFGDENCEYDGIGRQLYETEPTFHDTFDQCDEILGPQLGHSIVDIVFGSGTETNRQDLAAGSCPTLFALEYALAQVWLNWGIQPSMLFGRGVGEYVAACLAGVFSLDDALVWSQDMGLRA